MPVWHASVALQGERGPKDFVRLSKKQIQKGISIASKLLGGVGGELISFTTDPPDKAIHVQKPLTEIERVSLPAGWMEVPAIDERGPCRRI